MNSEQRYKIRGLVRKYSESGTESLIAFVAETDGLLPACQALLHSLDAAGSTSTEWLQRECSGEDVQLHAFLEEITKIVALFQPSRQEGDDHHATLGISPDAGLDEIKQAYRSLSLRYHPDTASSSYRDNPDKFIAINKAYHALLNLKADSKSEKEQYFEQEKQWRRKKTQSVSTEQRKKIFTWTLGLLIIFSVISAIASMNYKKRAMLAGLQESRGAFIPPVRKTSGASADKAVNVEKQPTELPSLPVNALEKPKQEFVAMVQVEPKFEPMNVQLKDLPPKRFAKESATEAIPNKEQRSIKQPVESQPTRTKERMEVSVTAHTAPSSSLKLPTGKESSVAADNQFLEQHGGVKSKTEKTGGPVLVSAVEHKDVKDIVAGAIEKASQPSAVILNHQPDLPEHANSSEPDVIFNKKVPAPAKIIASNTEREAQLTQATVTEVTPLPIGKIQEDMHKQEAPDMQTRVDRFLANYTKAYEQRNLLLFSRFFESDAEENGKPFTTMLPTYHDLFAATIQASLQVEHKSFQQVDGKITIDGRFTIYLKYMDGRTINGSGPIGFVLSDNGGELLVKKMKYVFHTE